MGEVKELNIKNRTYYYFDDMIDIRNFHSNLLKIDKKSHRDFDIYYIGYNTIKKLSNCNCNCDCDYKNIRCVNPFYLIIHFATGYFEEKYDEKFLIRLRNMKKFFLKLNQKLKPSVVEKNYFMKKIML